MNQNEKRFPVEFWTRRLTLTGNHRNWQEEADMKLLRLITVLQGIFPPTKNIYCRRREFFSAKQKLNQKPDQFWKKLCKLEKNVISRTLHKQNSWFQKLLHPQATRSHGTKYKTKRNHRRTFYR